MNRLLLATLLMGFGAHVAVAQTHLEETRKYVPDELNKLIQPEERVSLDDTQKASIQVAVRWNVYRLTAPTNHANPGTMNTILTNTEYLLSNVYKKEKDKDTFVAPKVVRDEFSAQMLETATKILENPNQPNITQINTARIFAVTAELSGDDKLLNYLCDLIAKADRIDAVKYYAFKGLGGVLESANKQQPPGVKDATLKKKINKVLMNFITRKSPLLPKAPQEEVEGVRVLRREAIRALAETRDPGAAKTDEDVAVVLARVVSNDGFDPPTRLDERVEAAIGLMRLDPKGNNDYQVDAAAYHVGAFLVYFATEYQNRKASKDPWKIHAARMSDALQNWKANTDPFVASFVKQGGAVLKDYEDGKSPRIEDYARILNVKTAAGPLYKSDPKSDVKIGQ